MLLNIARDSKLKSSINLIVVQISLYFIPIIATPYIVKKVGIENYGAFIFFQTVMQLLAVIGSYGFIQTGVRDIANAKTLRKLNYEFSNIFYSKFFALLVSALIGISLIFFDKFSCEKQLYTYSFLFLILNFLDTVFVYQGIEKLKDYVLAILIGNVVYLFAVFIFITRKDDYVYLPIVFVVPRIITAGFSLLALYFRFKIIPSFFSIRAVAKKMKDGFNFFMTNIFIILYTRTTVVLLGLITNNTCVGYYSLADQLFYAYSSIEGKVSSVYQPQIAYAFSNNFKDGVFKAKENILVISIMAIAAFMFTQFFSYEMLYILFKNNAQFSEITLRIISLNFLSIHLSSILGMQILLALYKDKELLRPVIVAAVLSVFLGSILIYFFKYVGAAISVATIEVLILLYFYNKIIRCRIEVFDKQLVNKIFEYTLALIVPLIVLRWLYVYVGLSIFVKLPVVIVLFTISVLVILKLLNIVDFKNKKILTEECYGYK